MRTAAGGLPTTIPRTGEDRASDARHKGFIPVTSKKFQKYVHRLLKIRGHYAKNIEIPHGGSAARGPVGHMLVAGRIAGWVLIALAVLLASGDAVLAFGTGEHVGIVTGTLWTLITGSPPEIAANASIGAMLMAWPAWAAIGPVGLILVVTCRPRRHRRFRYRRHDG